MKSVTCPVAPVAHRALGAATYARIREALRARCLILWDGLSKWKQFGGTHIGPFLPGSARVGADNV